MSKRKQKTILVIDDSKHIRVVMKQIIEKTGHKSIICASAHDALLEVKKSIPNLIISDFKLQRFSNGVDLAVAIRQSTRKKIPVIIMSGLPEAEEKAKRKDFTFIKKPFGITEMLSLIRTHLGNPTKGSNKFLGDPSNNHSYVNC